MEKRITVVTGGSSGLGLASARCLAVETSIVLVARNSERLQKAKEELESFGTEVETISCDLGSAEDVKRLAAQVADLGEVKNVVHAAGVATATCQDPARILKTNAIGTINMVNAFLPVLQPGGTMICTGSTAGYVMETGKDFAQLLPMITDLINNHWQDADFDQQLLSVLTDVMKLPADYQPDMAYCLSKTFVHQFVHMNISRFAAKGCRIVSVSPGAYLTPLHQKLIDTRPEVAQQVMDQTPLGRWGHPYEIGELVRLLCSDAAGYITGVDVLADGGYVYMPLYQQIQ